MLKLEAIYKQSANRHWDARILGSSNITVFNAKDLPTAKVFLETLVAEEYEMGKNRQRWEIITETIYHYTTAPDEFIKVSIDDLIAIWDPKKSKN